MNKVESDLEKFNRVREESSAEHKKMTEAVDVYLRSQVTEGVNIGDILKKYFEKYKDILESPLVVETMKTAERMEHLKRVIYMHEIRPKKEEKTENLQKAA